MVDILHKTCSYTFFQMFYIQIAPKRSTDMLPVALVMAWRQMHQTITWTNDDLIRWRLIGIDRLQF